jgi:hypothetical protein
VTCVKRQQLQGADSPKFLVLYILVASLQHINEKMKTKCTINKFYVLCLLCCCCCCYCCCCCDITSANPE